MTPHERAIYKTLLVSVRTGLNATLTPDDSKTLINMLRPDNTKIRQRKENPLDRIARNLGHALADTIENLADDLEIPTKKRR
jgi:hypothetical protein